MRQRFGMILAATGILAMAGATLLPTPSQALPPCNGRGEQCNQFVYNSKECRACLSCISKGGKFTAKPGSRFGGLCALKAERARPAPKPGGPSSPMEMERKR